MQIIDFIEKTELDKKTVAEKAAFLCYYKSKENGNYSFSMSEIKKLMADSGFGIPNVTRLKDSLTKGKEKAFLFSNKQFTFIPAKYQLLEREYRHLWDDFDTIDSNSELLDESKFCGKRGYLDKLICQINHTYANNCYDATAVLLRRLFEVLLVLSYQELDIDDEIKDTNGNGYIMLEGIVKNAVNNQKLKLSRVKNSFDSFRELGNYSAHSITYNSSKKDIDDIKMKYRVMLD